MNKHVVRYHIFKSMMVIINYHNQSLKSDPASGLHNIANILHQSPCGLLFGKLHSNLFPFQVD